MVYVINGYLIQVYILADGYPKMSALWNWRLFNSLSQMPRSFSIDKDDDGLNLFK